LPRDVERCDGVDQPTRTEAAPPGDDVAELIEGLCERGWAVATAESMTGGAIAGLLGAAPGAGQCVAGGITSNATEAKCELLGVAAERVVSGDAARVMAEKVRVLFGAEVGIAVTGVAGPDPQDGVPVGTLFISCATPATSHTYRVVAPGDPDAVRRQAVDAALAVARWCVLSEPTRVATSRSA
jgi:nicotinamide-nucleotide amidase